MTKVEREGIELVKKDNYHIYRMEDKRSCIVRLKKADYENNAKSNLAKGNQYEKNDANPTKKLSRK